MDGHLYHCFCVILIDCIGFLMRLQPGRVAQSVGHLTRKSGVLGSIPGLATYFRFSFRFFKKGSCQLLAKVCARVLVNRLGGLSLPRKSVVRLTDRPDMTLDVYRGHKTTIQPTNQLMRLPTFVRARDNGLLEYHELREDQFIHCQNSIFLIHGNTDNDNSFSLFGCLLNLLILTFSVCGISYYRWTTAMDFTYRVPLYIYNMPYALFY